jgi:tetratricopeptide (TPR) repeat protein
MDIQGVVFVPDALGMPGIPVVQAKHKTTIDREKKAFASSRDLVEKQAHAAILATMLYEQSKTATGDAQKKLVSDALDVLRTASKAAADKVDPLTLQMMGSYDFLVGDYASAEQSFSQLVAQTAKQKGKTKNADEANDRAWWVEALLQQNKNSDAVAALQGAQITDKTPELAYVAAWAKFRTGDEAGAWQAMVTAAKGWGNMAGKQAVDRDLLLFAGRTNTSMADAVAALSPLHGKDPAAQYEMYAALGLEAYQYAGRWADGVAALDKALAAIGDKVPAADLPTLRYEQADYTVRLDDPATVAKYAKEAIDALPACTSCKPETKQNIVSGIYVMARLFHGLYATAHDDRFYQPAHDLYAMAIPLMTTNQAEAQKDETILEQTKARVKKLGPGKHDPGQIGPLLSRHNQEVQACYEQALTADPKLGGTLVLNLDADQNGAITGASTDPKAGMSGVPQVAGCIAERARSWKLPKKDNGTAPASSTRITLTYKLAVRKP